MSVCLLACGVLQMVEQLLETFKSGKTREKSFRIQQLRNILRMLNEKEDEITEAVFRDLRRVSMHVCTCDQ